MDISTETVGVVIASFRLGLTRVQQSVQSEWQIQDVGQLSKNVPLIWSVLAHLWNHEVGHKVILGSSIVSQTLTLRWPRVNLNFFLGGGGASAV